MNATRPPYFIFCFYLLFLFCSCQQQKHHPSVMFGQASVQTDAAYDLTDIQASGELIATVLSGPDTYYEYRGEGFGVEYELAKSFASRIGTRLRVELATDSDEMMQKLASGEADIALTQPLWQTRPTSQLLTAAVEEWWRPDMRQQMVKAERQRRLPQNRIRRTVRPPMLSREKGIISNYDIHFQHYAPTAGVDWRLLAAQCYQESAFDPHAVSWAGAQGLMQIMPATAAHLGLPATAVFDPEQNIAAAARYMAELQTSFADIRERGERLSFVLAAYNGGVAHVRDAMALTVKYGGNPHRWQDVDRYILLLAEPHYYRDPVVRAGYLRGRETSGYVRQILERWTHYRGTAHATSPIASPRKSTKKTHIRSREEFLKDSL